MSNPCNDDELAPDDGVTRSGELRRWARGLLPLEAAVSLLTDAVGGRLLSGAWIRHDEHVTWFDADTAASESGCLSGGERRALGIACSLTSSQHPVDLGDAVTGLDPATLRLVLSALAHAGGQSALHRRGWLEATTMRPVGDLHETSERPASESGLLEVFRGSARGPTKGVNGTRNVQSVGTPGNVDSPHPGGDLHETSEGPTGEPGLPKVSSGFDRGPAARPGETGSARPAATDVSQLADDVSLRHDGLDEHRKEEDRDD